MFSQSKNLLILIYLISLVGVIPSFANEESHYAAASQLVSLTVRDDTTLAVMKVGIDTNLKTMLDMMEKNCQQQAKTRPYCNTLGNVIQETIKETFDDRFMMGIMDKMKRKVALLYMDQLTEAELGEALRFYNSKTGQKVLSLSSPKTVNQMAEETGRLMAEELESARLEQKFNQTMQAKVKALQEEGKLPNDVSFPGIGKSTKTPARVSQVITNRNLTFELRTCSLYLTGRTMTCNMAVTNKEESAKRFKISEAKIIDDKNNEYKADRASLGDNRGLFPYNSPMEGYIVFENVSPKIDKIKSLRIMGELDGTRHRLDFENCDYKRY